MIHFNMFVQVKFSVRHVISFSSHQLGATATCMPIIKGLFRQYIASLSRAFTLEQEAVGRFR